MPTFTLTAVPATRFEEGTYRSTEMMVGKRLGERVQIEARTIEEIAAAVLSFGRGIQTAHPERSFEVFVAIAKGQRKPRGFDAACQGGTLRNQAFLWTVCTTPSPYGEDAGVVMWGSRFTPFQLEGQPVILRDETPDEFTPHADGHLGLYGWMRMVNARIQRRTHCETMVFDHVSGVVLREHYRNRQHPFAVADDLLGTGHAAANASDLAA